MHGVERFTWRPARSQNVLCLGRGAKRFDLFGVRKPIDDGRSVGAVSAKKDRAAETGRRDDRGGNGPGPFGAQRHMLESISVGRCRIDRRLTYVSHEPIEREGLRLGDGMPFGEQVMIVPCSGEMPEGLVAVEMEQRDHAPPIVRLEYRRLPRFRRCDASLLDERFVRCDSGRRALRRDVRHGYRPP